jgi:hypothetical protein
MAPGRGPPVADQVRSRAATAAPQGTEVRSPDADWLGSAGQAAEAPQGTEGGKPDGPRWIRRRGAVGTGEDWGG